MERSKSVISIIVGLAAVLIVWRVGFYPPVPEQTPKPAKVVAAAEPSKPAPAPAPAPVQKPSEANEPVVSLAIGQPQKPANGNQPKGAVAAASGQPGEPNGLAEPNGPMEFVNLKSVAMKDIIEKLAAWTGKVIIPTDDALQQRVTIYAPAKLPRSKAIAVIYSALRMQGFTAKESDNEIFLEPIANAKLGRIPTVAPNEPLALIQNKEQIVQKFFQMKSYSASDMASVIQPLIGEQGYVSADEATGTLMVIDTVANLMRLERIIQEFDVPSNEQAVTDIIQVRFGDPSEIVQMLNILLGETQGLSSQRSSSRYSRGSFFGGFRGRPEPSSNRERSSSNRTASSQSKLATATSVVVGTNKAPVVLIPDPRRKCIIVKASADDLKQIREWVNKLDKAEPVESEYEVVQLKYADPQEVVKSVGEGFQGLPGTEFLPNILLQPLTQTKQVIVFGRKDLRDIVKKMIQEVDVPPGLFQTVHIKLKHADPDMIKQKLDELYQQGTTSSSRYGFYGGYRSYGRGGSSSQSSDMVNVVSYPSLKEVTVVASPDKLDEIRKRITEWDVPLDVNDIKPRIIELKNMDPVQTADLLNTLFGSDASTSSSSNSRSRSFSIFRAMFGSSTDQSNVVGALYGQLTFQDVPGTKKIICVSKIPEAYDVVEKLVKELDTEEPAEVPTVIELKYADPEKLSELLNAMFAQPGTSASLQRSATGLSDYTMDSTTGTSTSSSSSQNSSTQTTTYTPWWSGAGARSTINTETPISNIIGRIRFVPDTRTKSVLVLSPPEYIPQVQKLIDTLDTPGRQVMVKAIIVEVDHENMTSLGVELAPTGSEGIAFGSYNENTATILNQLSYMETHGAFTFQTNADVTAMLDFLEKKTSAKILNQQTLWTKDNEEASFFKGSEVAFFTTATTSATAGNVQNFEFQKVGMTLAVRPSITPGNDVDMIINIIISQLTSEEQNGQPVRTAMDTKTNMIVQDGQTIMLGGILFQQDRTVRRKVPLLGDVPLLGALFSHNETNKANNEMLVFITPYVIDEPNATLATTTAEVERSKEKLEQVRKQLNDSVQTMDDK